MQLINDYNFAGKKALVRVDFNVPLKDGVVTDDTRIRGALATIKKIVADGGSVILMSHLGRPKGEGAEPKYSLKPVIGRLEELVGKKVIFAEDCIGEAALAAKKGLKAGEILLLENLRFYKKEEKGDVEFAKLLAEGADVYVNDAFGTAHRAHASTAIVGQFFSNENKMFGYLINSELVSMDKVLFEAKRPFTAVMGGAKVSDKISIIENLLQRCDNLIIGGAMTYTFIKAQGGEIGDSLVEADKLDLALDLIKKAKEQNVKLYLPIDNVLADNFDNNANTKIADIDKGEAGWKGLDIGPKTIELFKKVVSESATVLWNGPMGVFEMDSFQAGTKAIADAVALATSKGAFSLIGGGDSVAAINKYKLADQVSYVSTGGGAMLEYMEGKPLPGIVEIRGK